MKLGLSPLAVAAALAACSSSDPAPEEPPTPAGGAPSETAACADGTYRTLAGACEAFPSLTVERSSTQIAPVRDHHATAVVETTSGPWLYVIGGTDAWNTLHNDVLRAPIGDGGKLGAFESAGTLPAPRAGHCMVKKGDRLYLLGGIVGDARKGPSTSSVVLALDAEGKVTSTSPGPELPTAVMHVGCELAGDSIYAMGGRGTDSKSTKLSARTKIAADGTLSPFENLTPLAPDRSHHAVFVRGKTLYLLGGLRGDPVGNKQDNRKDIVAADIAPDGTLGEWYGAGTLPTSISVSSAQLYKDAVYVFGGLESDAFSAKIRRATFLEDGTLSDFTTLKTELPDARGHVHQTPMHGPFIFSVGGKNDLDESLGTIDVGRFE